MSKKKSSKKKGTKSGKPSSSGKPVFRSIIPAHIANNSSLNCYEKMTYCMIDSLSGRKGFCWPSHETLAQLIGCSVRTVIRSIRRLEELGLLKQEKQNKAKYASSLRYYPQRPSSSTKLCDRQTDSKPSQPAQRTGIELCHTDREPCREVCHTDRQIYKDIKTHFSPLPPHGFEGEKRLLNSAASTTPPVTTHRPLRGTSAACGVGGESSLMRTFEKLWAAYPKKEAFGLAKSTFFKMKRVLPSIDCLLDCISFKMNTSWAGKEIRYIPSLEYFLQGERWLDGDYVEYKSAPKAVPAVSASVQQPELTMKAPELKETPEETQGITSFVSSIARNLSPAEKGVIGAFWRDLHRKGITLTAQDGAKFGNGALYTEMRRLSAMRAAV